MVAGGGLAVVAVVGRANVGKSTLVNRIVGRREAIVEERPGVTRDRKALVAEWCGRSFLVVDTGGWAAGGNTLDAEVTRQAERAWAEADVVLLVADAVVGPIAEDEAVADRVRRGSAPLVLVANKVDGPAQEGGAWDLVTLGLGDPWPVSAMHGRGTGDLLDEVVRLLPEGERPGSPPGTGPGVPAVAVVGRPNAGKSTLFNRLIGEDRSVVHDLPGTTRDSIDTVVETEEGTWCFVDTAGMRRRSRVHAGPERYSLVRALRSIDAAEAALLVIDVTAGVTHQDQRLAERVGAAGCPVVVVLNKWDVLASEARDGIRAQVGARLAFLSRAPVLAVSALTGKGVGRILPALGQAMEAYHQRVPTGALNQVIQAAQVAHPSPQGRVLYATQGATDPPTFTLFTDRRLAPTYLRYLERRIREGFALGNTPVKLRVRPRSG